MTVKEERVHGLVGGAPVNFHPDETFAQTQDLAPVQLFVYSVMMWRTRTFLQAFAQRGHALLSGKVGYFPVSKLSAVIVKTPEDLKMAEGLLQMGRRGSPSEVQYDPFANDLVKGATA